MRCLLPAFLLFLPLAARAQEPAAAPVVRLTTARAVLDLPKESIALGDKSARLTGVVTHVDRALGWFFIQDETAGMLIQNSVAMVPAVSSRVEAEGPVVSQANGISVQAQRVLYLGPGSMPASRLVKGAALDTQAEYCQYVSVEGRVTDAAWRDGALNLILRPLSNRIAVRVEGADPRMPLESWINSQVRATGVNWTAHSCKLHVSSPQQIATLTPSVPDSGFPLVSLARLPTTPGERVRVRATVAWAFPDGWIMLEQEGHAVLFYLLSPLVRARTDDRYIQRPTLPILVPGMHVEVAGSISSAHSGSGGRVLEDGIMRVTGQRSAPQPAAFRARRLYEPADLYRLVTVEGRLVSTESRTFNRVFREKLLLEADGVTFEALIDSDNGRRLDTLPRDYMIEVTGFVSPPAPDLAPRHGGPLARVWLRTPADARTLHLSGSAIMRRVTWGVGCSLLAAAAAGAWIWSLRRRVAEASAELRRALEAEREINQLKSDFVSLVSHEFRTPLGVIMSSAEILESYFESLSAERRETQLARIVSASRRMAAMMEEVLLLGRMEAGKMQFVPAPLDLPGFARRVTDGVLAATGHKCTVILQVAELPPGAAGDAQLLHHIFSNLLLNAVKYSPDGSTVTFDIKQEAGMAVFTIEDHGIGIPTSDMPRLYDPFYRGRNVGNVPGTGLGMVIVRRCLELHGGTIHARSRTGEGTCFILHLPLFAPPVPVLLPPAPPADP